MSYYPIDTHATVREFEAAGIETKQAEAIVKAMTWSRNDLVTKTDLTGFATKEDLKQFATKEDLKRFATKEDLEELKSQLDALSVKMERYATKAYLEKFATKEDLERFATKEDLKRFATKEDFERCATKEDLVVLRAEMAAMKSDLEKQIGSAVNKMLIGMISMSAIIVGMMKYL